jgi:hypothetical protein
MTQCAPNKQDLTVIKQVMALRNMTLNNLDKLWRNMFDHSPAFRTKQYMLPKLAYRIQELAYGGIDVENEKKLIARARELENSISQSLMSRNTRHSLARKSQTNTKALSIKFWSSMTNSRTAGPSTTHCQLWPRRLREQNGTDSSFSMWEMFSGICRTKCSWRIKPETRDIHTD